MKSLILKRSVVLRGHKTSISVEDAFWNSVKEIAGSGQMSVSDLLSAIDSERHHGNLSSAIRLFVLNFYREQQGAHTECNRNANSKGRVRGPRCSPQPRPTPQPILINGPRSPYNGDKSRPVNDRNFHVV